MSDYKREFMSKVPGVPLFSERASTHFVRHWLAGRIDLDLASAAQYLSEAAHITLARGENSRRVERKTPAGTAIKKSRRSEVR